MTETEPPSRADGELGRAARGGAITLVGAGLSAVLGFALSFLMARALGADGVGVVWQAIAAFTIVMSLARLGLDTTAVWLLPQLMSLDRSQVRGAVVGLLVPAFVLPCLVTAGWFVFRAVWATGDRDTPVIDAISVVAIFLPAACVMTVALASTRAFGGVVPFNLIGNILVPALRPVLIVGAVAAGGSTTAVALGWATPWLVGMVLALAVLLRKVTRVNRGQGGGWRTGRAMYGRIFRFSLPRVLASGLDQTITWLDVILVGIIAGPTAAGVYGSVSRFVNAGVVVATAFRIVVAPRFSALLSEGKPAEVGRLYAVTARWILLFGAPAYIILATFAPTVLGWLGAGFSDGVASMIVLCFGSIVVLSAGNVQSLLLMSGRSAASAQNKAIVVAFNVAGNLLLVPLVGIIGAASVWAASMVLDTALAAWQVRRSTGLSLEFGSIAYVATVVTLCVAVPAVAVALVLGQGTWQLIVAVVLGGMVLLGYAFLDRRRLELGELRHIRRPTATGSPSSS
ncbi:conserved membrane hypothetical protein [metagenome]|uniref:Uncharacterized protein n=1 Tax=metagenome TaxID=256318 RepID=A0A2P2BZB8_9ZZZZ